jgi:hypothetical protein
MEPDTLSRNVGKKLPPLAGITTQKSAVLKCFSAETSNMTFVILNLILTL